MEMQEIIRQAEENIRQAIRDYGKHTDQHDVLDDISDTFIERLARDSSRAKQGLRELFSQSPVWDSKLDALVINGTRTHDPDYERVNALARQILWEPLTVGGEDQYKLIQEAIDFFSYPNSVVAQTRGLAAINTLAPKAYQPGKKLSRVFKSLCVALGVADETAGSPFQHLYAQFADELTSRKIGFKLFVSINPAHFLTMSNPKNDQRGMCLTSCHSLNSTEYEYNCGCAGYARDKVSFIAFTVADPNDEESLNNRKTTRQVFAYKPGNGVLLQSRMYNTAGGTYGRAEDSQLYRDLIQREISMLEGQPNLWRPFSATSSAVFDLVRRGYGFGGYADWTYENFGGMVCIRCDCENRCEPLVVGTYGLCVKCGDEIGAEMYCDDCKPGECVARCDDCDEGVEDEDDIYEVYDSNGNRRFVCYDCRESGYICCDHCGRYYDGSVMEHVDGRDVCPDCLEQYYEACEDCGDYCKSDEMYQVTDQYGGDVWVCPGCRRDHYETCECCNEVVHEDHMCDAFNKGGDPVRVCEACYERYDYAVNEEDAEEAM